MFNGSDKVPTTGKYAGNENAKVVDTYNLFTNNCVTSSIDGVQSGVKLDLKLDNLKGPIALKEVLNIQAGKENSGVTKVPYEKVKEELKLPNGASGSWKL
ncbi:MAG: hypothetical protein LWW91_09195 [Bacteroidales bacterium]|nr:hypothetical protein [Bacteroidales bacterium]